MPIDTETSAPPCHHRALFISDLHLAAERPATNDAFFRFLEETAGGAQGVLAQLSQLIGQGGNEMDDFDALAELSGWTGVDDYPGPRHAPAELLYALIEQMGGNQVFARVTGVQKALGIVGQSIQNVQKNPDISSAEKRQYDVCRYVCPGSRRALGNAG